MRRVVVTGLGAVTPLALGRSVFISIVPLIPIPKSLLSLEITRMHRSGTQLETDFNEDTEDMKVNKRNPMLTPTRS